MNRPLPLFHSDTARCWAASLLLAALFPLPAMAHVAQGDISGGFAAGFVHPILGLDHVVAMVAVGIWGAQLGNPAAWVLPVTFPMVMALGGALGGLGVPLPGVEIGIAASAITLGAMIVMAAHPPLWGAGTLVAIFAVFHGYAHGAELPESANPISYAAGFVIATGGLHLLGIAVGLIRRWGAGSRLLRATGGLIAATGAWFLLGHFGV